MSDHIPVDLADTAELVSFRNEVRGWLAENLIDDFRMFGLSDPTAADDAEFEVRRAWQRLLHGGGWAGVHWPREYGGRSASLLEHAIFLHESAQAGAPEPVNTIGLSMVGPTIIEFGSEEQRSLLPSILSADEIWCQLFSEPAAGSDLGNIATRATETSDGWEINGQKLWTSWGSHADRGLLLARTSAAPGGRGLSCFLLDMHAPGVTVNPLRQISGGSHFSEVQLDHVAISATAIVGAANDGWKVAMSTLVSERTTAIFSRHSHTIQAAEALLDLATTGIQDPLLVDTAAKLWSEAQLLRLAAYDGIWQVAEDAAMPTPASLLLQRLQWGLSSRAIMQAGDRVAARNADRTALATTWRRLLLASRGWTIGGGTSEIQRNMLAERVLGLPRQPRPPAPVQSKAVA